MLFPPRNHLNAVIQNSSSVVEGSDEDVSLPKPTARRLNTIDALRAFAAIAVVITHIAHHGARESIARRLLVLPLDFGYLGVTCFLVISGFCIHLAASARPGGVLVKPRWGAFWKRRMYRLYPAYAIAALLSYAVYRCLDPALYPAINQVHSLGYDVASHALMLHNLFERFPFSLGNGVFWTLGLEEQLYALYAVYFALRRKRSARALAIYALGVSLFWRFVIVVPFGSRALGRGPLAFGSWWTWPFGWWFCWVLGAVAAEAYVGVIRLPSWCFSLRVAGSAAAVAIAVNQLTLGQLGYSRFVQHAMTHSITWWITFQLVPQCAELAFALCVFVCINRLAQTEHAGSIGTIWSRFATIGRMSYSLYLTHVPIVILIQAVLLSSTSASSIALNYAVLGPACLACGWLYFATIERHFALKRNSA